MRETLTAKVLSAVLETRQMYKVHDDEKKRKMSQDETLSFLLGAYVEAEGEINKDFAHLLFAGKRLPTKALVRFYSDGPSLCPRGLYDDVVAYCSLLERGQLQEIWRNLCNELSIMPGVDREEILRIVNACQGEKNKTYTLLTCLLYYAWRTDLCQYRYLSA